MRLINTTTYERHDIHEIEQNPIRYAILSHRWLSKELTYATYNTDRLKSTDPSPHLAKIRGACRQAVAEKAPLDWIWIDNVCIDKSSSTELSEAINSMFAWYRDAEICYTYLQDTNDSLLQSSGQPSEWFSRGWTLQELIAPREPALYDASWTRLGSRAELAPQIESATKITAKYLDGRKSFRSASIAARLSWQASRTTTRIEDMTYSLLGVLGISLDIRYGEGADAFMRLQSELLRVMPSSDESLFAWIMPPQGLPSHSLSSRWKPDEWGLLAPSPHCFANSGDIITGELYRQRPATPLSLTGDGVVFPMPQIELWSRGHMLIMLLATPTLLLSLILAHGLHMSKTEFPIALNCWRKDPHGMLRPVQVILVRDGSNDQVWRRAHCSRLALSQDDSHLRSQRITSEVTILQPRNLQWEKG